MAQLPAVILGSHANALTFARSLGRRGVVVWLLDSEYALGHYTRYARVLSLPDVEQEPQQWLDTLNTLGERLGPSVLLSTTDAHCLWLAHQNTALSKYFRFLTPDEPTTEQIIYKDKQYQAACSAQVPLPRSYFPGSLEALREISAQVRYPCLFKPTVSHRGRRHLNGSKVIVAQTATELICAYRRHVSDTTAFFVQEIVPGGDDAIFVYLGFWDTSGQERTYVTFQKLRQYPLRFGNGSLFQTIAASEIVEPARRLLRELRYTGLAEVEFKRNPHTGEIFLIEVNPRAGTMAEVARAAGIDLGWLTYRYLSDSTFTVVESFRPGIRVVDEEMDVHAFSALARNGELSLGEWLHSVRGARPVIAAWDDPMPVIMGMARAGRRILVKT